MASSTKLSRNLFGSMYVGVFLASLIDAVLWPLVYRMMPNCGGQNRSLGKVAIKAAAFLLDGASEQIVCAVSEYARPIEFDSNVLE